jgi:hypothetical protein
MTVLVFLVMCAVLHQAGADVNVSQFIPSVQEELADDQPPERIQFSDDDLSPTPPATKECECSLPFHHWRFFDATSARSHFIDGLVINVVFADADRLRNWGSMCAMQRFLDLVGGHQLTHDMNPREYLRYLKTLDNTLHMDSPIPSSECLEAHPGPSGSSMLATLRRRGLEEVLYTYYGDAVRKIRDFIHKARTNYRVYGRCFLYIDPFPLHRHGAIMQGPGVIVADSCEEGLSFHTKIK